MTLEPAGRFFLNHVPSPSPGVFSGACLVMGCAVVSHIHRHRTIDRYQTPVFLFVMMWSALVGLGVGAPAEVLMLAYVPWGACLAMILSRYGHMFVRWTRDRRQSQAPGDAEKN